MLAWLPVSGTGRCRARALSSFLDAADNAHIQLQVPTAATASQKIALPPADEKHVTGGLEPIKQPSGSNESGKAMDDLERSLVASKANVHSTKASLKDVQAQLDKLPDHGKNGEELSREQRVQRLQLKKQEQVLVGQESKALEEQLAATKAIQSHIGVANVNPAANPAQGDGTLLDKATAQAFAKPLESNSERLFKKKRAE